LIIFARLSRYIVYIINPISGKGRASTLRRMIEKKTSESGIGFEFFSSTVNGDYNFLLPYISEKKVTDVVIAGGDGTISQVVGSLLDKPLNFGIIPCGSGNGLAFAAGIPRDPSRALDLVLKGMSFPTDGFLVNDRFACMLCGFGFDAKVAHDFARSKKRGLYTYVSRVMKNFFSATAFPFELECDDHILRTDAFFISIANSNQFGNHFTIAPKARLDDGLLDVVVVTRQNKVRLLWQTLRQVRGVNKLEQVAVIENRRGIIYFQVPAIKISNTSLAPFHIDGDPADSGRIFQFQVVPHCFRLIRPKN
jgi:YegS/Rv2252/BmrU family lipid kinase